MRTLIALLLVTTMAAAAHAASLQTVVAIAPGGRSIVFASTTDRGGSTTLRVGKQTSRLVAGLAIGDLVVGHERVVAAFVTNDVKRPFHIAVYAGGKLGKPIALARPAASRRGHPFAVAATPTTAGFTVLFQELDATDPSTAHTYLQKLDASGAVSGAATEIAVPWGIAAITQTEQGYHLAVLYPQGPRLSMVGLDEAGSPQQHPDWASPAGPVSEVHLVHVGASIHALYRGGAKDDRILDADVTAIGSWGGEPAAPMDRGPIAADQVLVVDGAAPRAIERSGE